MDPTEYYENMLTMLAETGLYPYPHRFQVTMSIPEYLKKYENSGRFENELVALSGRIMNKRASSAMLFIYDLRGQGANLQVKANAKESELDLEEFTKFHSGVKCGDIVRIIRFPGITKTGGLSTFPQSFIVLSHFLDTMPQQKGAQTNPSKLVLGSSQNGSVLTTTDHHAGKFEAKFYDKVVSGGGQDASAITSTDHLAGRFEAKFYDKILQEEIGGVKGHFGPMNALTFNPDGKSFASGGEDGYVRLHPFESDYFNIKV